MAQFPVNPRRFDPYKTFKFRVILDGRVVASISHLSGLVRSTEVITHRDGAEPSTSRKSPGRTQFEAITLERGVTQDAVFEDWANQVWRLGGQPEVALRRFRKDLRIELMNEAGQVVKAWKLYRCWVSRYQALPTMDADSSAIALESITIETEGWERDSDVAEPAEP